MEQNFNDAVRKLPKHHALVCPHCHEARLEKLRPHGSGVVYCLTCDAQFEVKE